MSARLMFHVQHLLGIGHLRRAATLSRHFAAAGYDTVLTSGGAPVPGLDIGTSRLVQLPPVRATDKLFKVLVDDSGAAIDDAFKARRAEMLVDTLRRQEPDILFIELFPFGRRQLRFELMPLVEAAKALPKPPRVVSSVRDILVQSPKPERVAEMVDLFGRYFDDVLVHGDAAFIPFSRTFPEHARLADRTHHTGYVIDGLPKPGQSSDVGRGDRVGRRQRRRPPLTALRGARGPGCATWRGASSAGTACRRKISRLARACRACRRRGIVVERARGGTTMLANCVLSISQGGYNTIIETLSVADRAVIAPMPAD